MGPACVSLRTYLIVLAAHVTVASCTLVLPISVSTTAAARVLPEFVSTTMDAGQFFPGHFWKDNVSFPFQSQALLSLAAALAPAFFRVGGTEQDHLWYDMHNCFAKDRCSGRARLFKEALPKSSLDDLFHFARSAGYKVVFGLNAGLGPRNGTKAWTPDNAAELIAFATQTYPDVSGWWELGNEPEAFTFFQHTFVGAQQLVDDFQRLRSTLADVSPSSHLLGIDSFGNPPFEGPDGWSFLPSFLKHGGGDVVDIVTYHWYPLLGNCGGFLPQSQCHRIRGYATLEDAVTVAFNDTAEKFAHMRTLVEVSGKPLWLGEGSLAAAGGRDGVTNRFASTLFYLFELGQAATTGHAVFLRQCLAGAAYGLIDVHSLKPLPDYWGALLYKRLMGTQVHEVTVSWPLRGFAHCHPTQYEKVTVLIVNPSGSAWRLNLTQAGGAFSLFLMTGGNATEPLASSDLRINGKLMEAPEGILPHILPVTFHGTPSYTMPPFSAGFFLFDFAECGVLGQRRSSDNMTLI